MATALIIAHRPIDTSTVDHFSAQLLTVTRDDGTSYNLRTTSMSFHSVTSTISSTITSTLFPRDASYNSIRPHHVVVLYALARVISSSSFYQKLSNSVLRLLSHTSEALIPLVYRGLVPDALIRLGIRIQLYQHLSILKSDSAESELNNKLAIVQELHTMPIAIQTDAANAQHYEVPAKFYDLCLGPCKKYSSGLWPTPTTTFEESEIIMLDLYCQRAGVKDGMHIVDLGMYLDVRLVGHDRLY